MMKKAFIVLFIASLMLSCSVGKKEIQLPYSANDFIATIDGKPTGLYTLKNKNGMVVTLTNYGAKIVSIYAPDKNGNFADVVLGFKSITEYQKNDATHGATVGPYANRIANASFVIDSIVYQLPANDGKACLHSGPNGWYRRVWVAKQENNSVAMELDSPDGDLGFPGNKKAKVTFILTDENELRIDYELTTDKACFINLTNHSYFNLHGEGNGDILDHMLTINADRSTPVDEGLIPTGELANIKNTPLDFTTPRAIGERINSDDQQMKFGKGYDFNYVLNKTSNEMSLAASLYEPQSGRLMEIFTTEPGIQFYSGNFMQGKETGKSGNPYAYRTALCLETQHFPDSPHRPDFPSTLVKPGDVYKTTTVHKFSVK